VTPPFYANNKGGAAYTWSTALCISLHT